MATHAESLAFDLTCSTISFPLPWRRHLSFAQHRRTFKIKSVTPSLCSLALYRKPVFLLDFVYSTPPLCQ